MNYIISGKNIEVTEGLKSAIYDKLGRLEKF
ncbi:MAG: ribosome-associated translation inhibitor RaiA, partial [Lachnospiraceae bacterium]|nr:ribosome-associated translation inhibitor RaiA [Lachnospiraceae bacterium]